MFPVRLARFYLETPAEAAPTPVLSPALSEACTEPCRRVEGGAEGPPDAGLRRELSRTAWEPGPLVSRQELDRIVLDKSQSRNQEQVS